MHPTEHGVIFVKYCSILLQALTIEADEDLLFAIYDLTQIKGVSWDEDVEESVYPTQLTLFPAADIIVQYFATVPRGTSRAPSYGFWTRLIL